MKKSISLISSYLILLIASYLGYYKPYGIFISYLIEILVLIGFYSIFRSIDTKKNPSKYRKQQPLINVLIALIPFVFIQFLLIGWTAGLLNPEENFIQTNLILTKEVLYAFLVLIIIYGIEAWKKQDLEQKINTFLDNFFLKILLLSGANLIGSILVLGFGLFKVFPVILIMVLIRIGIELIWIKKIK